MSMIFESERKLKMLLPNSLKFSVLNLLIKTGFGHIVKFFNPRRTLANGFYNFKNATQEQAVKIYFGAWESAEIRIAKNFVESPVIVELGSSIGVMVGALAAFKEQKRFYLIEANFNNIHVLEDMVSYLRRTCKTPHSYSVFNLCISGKESYVNFSLRSTTGSKISDEQKQASYPSLKMKSTTLSNFVEKNLGTTTYCLIADIEGEEASILFDDPQSLRTCNEIVIELEDTNLYTINQQISRLNQLGFEVIYRYGNVAYFRKTKILS